MAVLPKQLMQYFNETPSIKTESLHFNHILTVKKKQYAYANTYGHNHISKTSIIAIIFVSLFLNKHKDDPYDTCKLTYLISLLATCLGVGLIFATLCTPMLVQYMANHNPSPKYFSVNLVDVRLNTKLQPLVSSFPQRVKVESGMCNLYLYVHIFSKNFRIVRK